MKCGKCQNRQFSTHGKCNICGAKAPAPYNGAPQSQEPTRKPRNFGARGDFGTVVREPRRKVAA